MATYSGRMDVRFVPVPRERKAAWRAAIAILADWLIEDEIAQQAQAKRSDPDGEATALLDGGGRQVGEPVPAENSVARDIAVV